MLGKMYRLMGFIAAVWFLGGFLACNNDNGGGSLSVGSLSWTCDVSLRIDSLTGEGSGSGSSRDEALQSALRVACSKLSLDSVTLDQCEQNLNFGKSQTIGNVTIVSPAEKSVRCSGSF